MSDHTDADFKAEYAKSNRASCKLCKMNIAKDSLRLAIMVQSPMFDGKVPNWFHPKCFWKRTKVTSHTMICGFDALRWDDQQSIKDKIIPGYKSLQKDDKEMVLQKLGKGEKRKAPAESASSSKPKKAKKEETAEEKALKEQSELLWKYRDLLSKEVSNEAMKVLLEYNAQDIPSGESRLLDRVSDCLAFGALKPCPECGGQLVYSGAGYKCTGNVTEWTKCMHISKTPDRKAMKVPKEYHDVNFLKSYKYVKRERVFPKEAAGVVAGAVSSASTSDAAAWAARSLTGMKFVIAGKLSKSKAAVTKMVTDLGGKVVTKVDKKVAAVISTPDEVKKKSRVIADAEAAEVHVVDEGFLGAVVKGGAALLITSHSIAPWGSDPHDRIEEVDVADGPVKSFGKSVASKRDEKMFTKSVPKSVKMTVKGGAAVDPDSGLENTAHVLNEKGELYTAVLGMVDIVRGTNSYYKLQLLEMDKSQSWYVFRAWGRVGTTIGGNKLERCGSKASAMGQFESLYAEKTGNEWAHKKDFVKYPNKFYPLDIDYGGDNEEVRKLDTAGTNSKLPKPVQDLVKMIFDVESMKKTMLEFEIDMKKMPLGKLSKKQIESAYKVLTELNQLVEDKGTPTRFLDASNRFYTLIPHDFGMKKPPLLDTPEIIKSKTEMLDNLLEIEVAYSLLKTGEDTETDPLDLHYEKLKTEMEVLDKKDEEFLRLQEYVKNTHAATHNQYDLVVEDIFKVKREGEHKRYKPFKQLHNRQLLWHGSRTTNFAGILSQGLRIAPPEAPVTGYMFGKGVYFADMVSKSANYCCTSKSNPMGVMLLCEVALGNMHELTHSSYITSLPKGKHSTKGIGRTAPDPSGAVTTDDGVVIPMGKGVNGAVSNSSLLYNEFIVYDVAQINMKYLLKMRFDYKW